MPDPNVFITYDFSLPEHRVAFPKEQKFHRIMKFGDRGLADIVKEKALTFVTYDKWTDSHEAYFIQALRTLEGEALLDRVFKKLNYRQNARAFNMMIQASKRGRHMQSWTCGPESEEMWRIYSPDRKGVRVQTSALKVWNSKIEALPIVYTPRFSVEEEVKRLLSDNGQRMDFINIFTRKLARYSFEKEVRFISEDVFAFKIPNSGVVPGQEYLRKIDISHIPDFIESVVVDPEAEQSFVDEVERFCDANKIPFGGQSTLNKFELR